MKKILLIIISILVLALISGGVYYFFFKAKDKGAKEEIIAPPSIKKVNELEVSKRPYVALLPHPNPARCSGADLIIEDLKNGETLAEYELEYTAGSLIQGVFGRRDLTETTTDHQPLEFGTCSKGKCKCDQEISGGSLTLNFTIPGDEYTLKSDFTMGTVGSIEGDLISTDARLRIDVGTALARGTQVVVIKAMGLPGQLEGEILVGPYGVFVPMGVKAKGGLTITLQAGDDQGSLMYWNGQAWQDLKAKSTEGKLTTTMPDVGIVVLVK